MPTDDPSESAEIARYHGLKIKRNYKTLAAWIEPGHTEDGGRLYVSDEVVDTLLQAITAAAKQEQ